jgi:FMN phosphatase YigB (HAD superfamily)
LGLNTFPSFQDRFPPSFQESTGLNTTALYFKHCFPTIEQIVDKVMDVKKTSIGKDLRNVYILTNGAREWIAELKEALRQAAKWDKVTSSRDLLLNKEQKYIAQAIDMMIGHKAQIFIGNGVRCVAFFFRGRNVALMQS